MGKEDGEKPERRASQRKRQVAQGLKVVDSETRKQVAAARLDALENDNNVAEQADDDSDEYLMSSESDEDNPEFRIPGQKGKKKVGGKRKLSRHAHAPGKKQGAKPFAFLLEEADLESLPVGVPTYHTAAAPPPSSYKPRHFCSICGYISPYTCVRCGARFCCAKCGNVHNDTRCMKFTV